MAETGNIARPYARAVFEHALAEGDAPGLDNWQHALDLLAAIAADAGMQRYAADPRTSHTQLQQAVCDTAAAAVKVTVDKLHPPYVNLIALLAVNRRLSAAPDIARLFGELCADKKRVTDATMTTAAPITAAQRKRFSSALQSKLGRGVVLEFVVDDDLIGGAIFRAGDWVVDLSVRAQLQQLVGALRA